MKLLDASLLIYAVGTGSTRFARAHRWVEGVTGAARFSRFAGLRWTDPLRSG